MNGINQWAPAQVGAVPSEAVEKTMHAGDPAAPGSLHMGSVGAFTTIRLERPAGWVKAVLYRRARTLHLERDPQGGRSAGDRCSGGTPARTSGSAETAPRLPSAAQRPAPPPGRIRSAEFPPLLAGWV